MVQHRELPYGAPLPPEQKEFATTLAQGLEKILDPMGMNFCLFMFPADKPGKANYISNCTRESATIALREVLARWEGRYHEGEPEKKS